MEAAASIGTALARRGAVLRTVTDAGELLPTSGHGRLSPDDLLDRLAGVGPSRVSSLAAGVEQLCRAAGDGPVICLLGAVGPDDVADLIRRRSGPTTDLAVLVDIESWADAGLVSGRRGLSTAARGALARQREDAATLLRAAGWRVTDARADRSVADVWADLGAPVGPVAGPAASRSGRRHEPAGISAARSWRPSPPCWARSPWSRCSPPPPGCRPWPPPSWSCWPGALLLRAAGPAVWAGLTGGRPVPGRRRRAGRRPRPGRPAPPARLPPHRPLRPGPGRSPASCPPGPALGSSPGC